MTNTNASEIAKQLGRLGGEKTKEKYGAEHFRNISKKALIKRWGKKPVEEVQEEVK